MILRKYYPTYCPLGHPFGKYIDRKGLFTENETRKTLFRDTWRYFRYGYDPYALACHARGCGIYFFKA